MSINNTNHRFRRRDTVLTLPGRGGKCTSRSVLPLRFSIVRVGKPTATSYREFLSRESYGKCQAKPDTRSVQIELGEFIGLTYQ